MFIIFIIEKQTQAVIDAGALTVLTMSYLSTKNLTLRRDACLAVSNVAAGTYCQVFFNYEMDNFLEKKIFSTNILFLLICKIIYIYLSR